MDTGNTKTKNSSKNSSGKRSLSKSESKKQNKVNKKKNGSAKNKDQLQHTLVYERDNLLTQITEKLNTVFLADEQKVIKQYIGMYHDGDNVDALMENILLRFNTPRKFQLLKEVRKTIYSDEVQRYDEICVGYLRRKKAESIKRSYTVGAQARQEKVSPPVRSYTYSKTQDVQREPSFATESYMPHDKDKQPVQTLARDIQPTQPVQTLARDIQPTQDTIEVAEAEITQTSVGLEETDGDINIEHDAIVESKSEEVPAPVERNDVIDYVTPSRDLPCSNDVVVVGEKSNEGNVPQAIRGSPLSIQHTSFDRATNTITINATITLDGHMFRSHTSSISSSKTPEIKVVCAVSEEVCAVSEEVCAVSEEVCTASEEVCTASEPIVPEQNENTTLPVVDAAQPRNTTLPVIDAVKPVGNTTLPVVNAVDQVDNTTLSVKATLAPVKTLPDEPVTLEITREKTPELIPVVQKTITYQVSKEHKFIGLSISGGADSRYQREIRVVSVNPNSASAIAGLEVGQVLISLDDHSLTNATHAEACQLIRSTFRNKRNKVMNVTVAPAI